VGIEITDVMLQSLRPPVSGRLTLWDGAVQGLALRVTPTGVCSWSIRARTPMGERVRVTLGEWPDLGIKAARIQARIRAGEIAKGANPNAEKRAAVVARTARRDGLTVSAALGAWQASRAAAWSERYRVETARLVTKVIAPKLGDKLLTETTRKDCVSMIDATRKRAPSTATWVYGLASAFLNHAEAAGWITVPVLPRKGLGLIAPRAASRARVLTDDEVRAVWCAAEGLTPKTRAFARLLILTAARELEIADLAVGEVDLPRTRATFSGSRTKNRRSHCVPMHALAIAELQAVWPDRKAGPNYKLLGAINGSGFRGFSGLKARLDRLSGVSGWRWHDLRRTARSGMSRLGVTALHAECALNHISGRSALERTYDRHDYSAEAIAALTVWQDHVAAIVQEARAEAA